MSVPAPLSAGWYATRSHKANMCQVHSTSSGTRLCNSTIFMRHKPRRCQLCIDFKTVAICTWAMPCNVQCLSFCLSSMIFISFSQFLLRQCHKILSWRFFFFFPQDWRSLLYPPIVTCNAQILYFDFEPALSWLLKNGSAILEDQRTTTATLLPPFHLHWRWPRADYKNLCLHGHGDSFFSAPCTWTIMKGRLGEGLLYIYGMLMLEIYHVRCRKVGGGVLKNSILFFHPSSNRSECWPSWCCRDNRCP